MKTTTRFSWYQFYGILMAIYIQFVARENPLSGKFLMANEEFLITF